MTILPGGLDDPRVRALLEEHLQASRATSPPESLHALDLAKLKGPDVLFWSAWEGETLLGFGALQRLSPEDGEIKSMHTAPAHRGKGVGDAMLAHIVAAARSLAMTRLSLETGSADYYAAARALYAKHGFVECPPFGDYVLDPHSVFMRRELRRRSSASRAKSD